MTQHKKGELLNKAIVLASSRHQDQYDKGGKPYILHVLAVMYLLNTDDEELQCIAVGHDLFEDTSTTKAEMREMGFTQRIIDGIWCMTKIAGETQDEYLARVKSNPDSVRVKMADLTHNSDIRRMKGIREKDIARLVKYQKMYFELDAHRQGKEAS